MAGPRRTRVRAPSGQPRPRARGTRAQQSRPDLDQRSRRRTQACLLRLPRRCLRSRAGAPTAARPPRWPPLPMRQRPHGRPLSARAMSAAQQRHARTAAWRSMTGLTHRAQACAALAAGSPAAPPSPPPLLASAHMQVGHARLPLAVRPSLRVLLAPRAWWAAKSGSSLCCLSAPGLCCAS